ncbi:ParM/StbA family protein [Paenibacillus xylaniclasticus]|uniref:ParM/StbA family protein n=1 Tax=Paenibacillus xylaniclasticus TaxID=588083 RepID=UPI000FD9B6C1|nr:MULTISPECIES: ParM/StbA family protein [Paenibacillus]GFN32397.1 hypothetical protein PCURB6_26570 [Paenibacillus curdlanolyticus]
MSNICVFDLGFGWTKGKFKDRIFLQQSIIGEPTPMFEQNYEANDLIYDEQYFVGNLAIRHSNLKFFSMKNNKSDAWVSEIFMKAAVGYLSKNEAVNTITGLPVKFYFNQKDDMANVINGINESEKYKIRLSNNNPFSVRPRIEKIKIVPQGYGIAMDYLLNNDGSLKNKEVAKKRILVIDLGFYTLNLLGLETMKIMKESTSAFLGVDSAYKLLEQYIQNQFGKSPARYELDQYVISGIYEGVDITPLIQRAFKGLAMQIQNEIDSLNLHFDYYLIGGGAAHAIYEHLDLPNKLLADQLSQIRGYEKLGVRTWK